jgi:hypothetical protein
MRGVRARLLTLLRVGGGPDGFLPAYSFSDGAWVADDLSREFKWPLATLVHFV